MAISTFMGLETALRGILAQQEALDVTGHNISNANTDGYTRQTVTLTPFYPYATAGLDAPLTGGQLGGGVDVSAISRARDQYLDTQYQALSDGLQQVSQTLAEPSANGVSTLFSQFWSAWQDVANDPQSTAARQALIQKGGALADGINQLNAQLKTFQSQNADAESQLVGSGDPKSELNTDLGLIAQYNAQIKSAQAGGTQANDLLDKRDQLIDRVSQIVPVSVTQASPADGTVTLTFGASVTLVSGTTAYTASFDSSTGTLTSNAPGATPTAVTTGQLGGMAAYDAKLAGYLTTLQGVASTLLTTVNAQQAAGDDLGGNPGAQFFVAGSGTDLLDVSGTLTTSQIAAAARGGGPADGSNAILAANLPQQAASADTQYQTLVTTVGSDAQAAQRSSDAANSLLQSISNRRLSVTGVSLDEEMTNLLRFQRGYQASARALTAMDDMVNLLVNRTGRTGL